MARDVTHIDIMCDDDIASRPQCSTVRSHPSFSLSTCASVVVAYLRVQQIGLSFVSSNHVDGELL